MARLSIWKQARPFNTIELGGETIEVKPLTLENAMRLILLLAPYIARVESKWPRLVAALEATNGTRPKLLELLLIEWRQDLAFAPWDLIQAFGLCLNVGPEFIAEHAGAIDLIKAIPILDSVNDFKSLFLACKALGITVKYA